MKSIRSISIVILPLLLVAASGCALGPEPKRPVTVADTANSFVNAQASEAAQLDSLSWYDRVVFPEPPDVVQKMRDRNPDQELLFLWLPQNFPSRDEEDTFWHADTTWSLIRLAQYYAIQNDWYLYDTSGQRIEEWGGFAANWTRYCPEGTYGTSVGLTYPEWLIQVAMPQIMDGGPNTDWEAWGPQSSAYQGFLFEIFADCVGSFAGDIYAEADPDRDGMAEGAPNSCATGGDQDSLSILFREVNDWFGPQMYEEYDHLRFVHNGANKFVNPEWETQADGFKIESGTRGTKITITKLLS